MSVGGIGRFDGGSGRAAVGSARADATLDQLEAWRQPGLEHRPDIADARELLRDVVLGGRVAAEFANTRSRR